MVDSYTIPFHFFRYDKRCYIGIKKNINSLDFIDVLFSAAKVDFPKLEKSQVAFISALGNDPFVVGIYFEGSEEIPEKYQELKHAVKTV